MSLYSGVIQEQGRTIEKLKEAVNAYHLLAQELTDVLAQHIDVSEYEGRLKLLEGGAEWRQ